MTNFQALFDAMSNNARNERSNYHLTLGKLIEALSEAPAGMTVVFDRGGSPERATSYRGYYSDLAFVPSDKPVTVEHFLNACRGALGSTFEGYKGGDYLMEAKTPLWMAPWGCCGPAIMGCVQFGDNFILTTKDID